MKNIFKTFLILLVVIGFTSCEDSDLQIDQLYENVDTSGAVLRILQYPPDLVNISGGAAPNNLQYIMEVQEGDGSYTPNFSEVRYYLSLYNDQDLAFPTLDEDGNELGELLVQTINSSEFDELSAINGLPMYTLEITTPEILDGYFPTAVLTTPSFIVTRLELEMSDGRVWTNTNAGTTLSGPYFESPFFVRTILLPF